jgi:ATP-dependent RNA helicase DHX57
VHLKEEQLPIGFDPRGGTLDVVGNGSVLKKKKTIDESFDANILQMAKLFGMSPKEANAIFSSNNDSSTTARSTLWKVLCDAASLSPERLVCSETVNKFTDEDKTRNIDAATNECEALRAIFDAEEFTVKKDNSFTLVCITIPFDDVKLSLEVRYKDGLYPDLLPEVFLTLDDESVKSKAYCQGGPIHLKIVRFLSELSPGQECIFELFGYVQTLLQEVDEQDPALLLSKLNLSGDHVQSQITTTADAPASKKKSTGLDKQESRKVQKMFRRPREKSSFFNTSPSKTPPAEAHPKLPILMDRARKSLPAFKIRDEFLTLMKQASTSGRVAFVTGETGSGKSTQIPQYVLENDPQGSKIIVAQPRRLAATGVATRVAEERNESVGSGSVGYVVRGDSKTCEKTRLLFLTTGVLLRQLQSENALDNISHIVIDEVHERHLDTDVLLAILKQSLSSYPSLHIVLMSATMDADRLANYWRSGEVKNTPRMHIPGFTHPVKDFMLEDVLRITGYIPPKNKKKKSQYSRGGYQIQQSLVDDDLSDGEEEDAIGNSIESRPEDCVVPLEERLKRINEKEIDYDLIAVLIKTLLKSKNDDGSILCFLPGAGEIERASNAIQTIVRDSAITILPLHGGLTPEKQQQVFVPAKKGYTKVILSTNVAETSITIPDCTLVIDTCKEKQSSYDPINRMPLLLETFASRDSLKQRRGRAGRVRPGTCYKLVSTAFHSSLPEHGEPEIRRCSLDQTILSLLFLGLEDGTGNFLRLLLDPPSGESVKSAFYSLEKIGALSRSGDKTTLTPLGNHLAGIPAPPTVAKLLVMGCMLGCRNIAIAVSAGMSVGRSPFLRINSPNYRSRDGDIDQEKDQRNENILQERAELFKSVGNSDHAMLGKLFLLWQSCNGAAERRRLCDRFGLAFNSMREMAQLARQLESSLATSGFRASQDSNKNENSWRVVRSVIVSALSPLQIVRVQKPTTKYTETVEGAVAKDGVSKELKFFIREGESNDSKKSEEQGQYRNPNGEKRVFIHPSSSNFSVGQFSCPWLVYHRFVQTSRAFISDSTECNAYALLMFGGVMNVQASKGLIVLDDWMTLSANPRIGKRPCVFVGLSSLCIYVITYRSFFLFIGSLIGHLRNRVDVLLEKKTADPAFDITTSTEMEIITDLLKRDGC